MMRILGEIAVTMSAYPALSLLVKGTVVLALALAGAWLARKSRASVRHALLASAFSVLLALPVVSFIARPVAISVPVASTDGMVPPLLDFIPASSSGAPTNADSGAARAESEWSMPPLSTMLLYGWLFGSLLFLIPIVGGLLQVRTLRRHGLPWRQGQLTAEGLARRRVDVLLHESLSGPMTCGIVRAAILLPADAQSWNEQDLERALVHELEHVRRCDWVVHCLARLACTLYWFHPLVWVAWRRLALEAERSCDDAVLRYSEPAAYADQLVGLARRRSIVRRSPVLAMANRSDLAARISALLDRSQRRGPVGALLVAACIAAAAIILTMSPLRVVAAPLAFEVASVKSISGADARGPGLEILPGGRVKITNYPLYELIEFAYDVPYQSPRISGGPDWSHTERYEIEAKAPDNAVPDGLSSRDRDDRIRLMLQSLLADRFRLSVHHETRDVPVYSLVVGKNGQRLKKSKAGENDCSGVAMFDGVPCHELNGGMGRGIHGKAVSMSDTVEFVEHWSDRPVIDNTGLKGLFEIDTEGWTPMRRLPSTDASASGPDQGLSDPFRSTLFTIFDGLGLRLESARALVEIFVIEHVERPSAN